ncbi:MAG: branched-chain amino acid ABC transporter permease [Ilumatobacteraceae bacterium]
MDSKLITQSLGSGILAGSIYGVAAIGLALVFGVVKIVNFAHGVMLMAGMYAVWFLHDWTSIDPFVLALVAAAVGALVGFVLQLTLLDKLKSGGEHGPVLVTLGVALIFQALAETFFTSNPRSLSSSYASATITIGPGQFRVERFVAMGAAIVFTLGLQFVLRRTDLGRSIRAVAQDHTAAQLMGMNVSYMYAAAVALGTAAAFFAGGVSAPLLPITPYAGTPLLLMSFVAAVLGGLGNIRGAFVAGIVVGLVEGIGSLVFDGTLKTVAVFVLFVMVLLFRPEGLFRR